VVVAPFVGLPVRWVGMQITHVESHEVDGWAQRWPGRVVASCTNTHGRSPSKWCLRSALGLYGAVGRYTSRIAPGEADP